jgi:hypothetical protein
MYVHTAYVNANSISSSIYDPARVEVLSDSSPSWGDTIPTGRRIPWLIGVFLSDWEFKGYVPSGQGIGVL